MNNEEKLIYMFLTVHGNLGERFSIEITYDEHGDGSGVAVLKEGVHCWSKTKLDILFDFVTISM